jgi:hypothetical protein
MQICWDLADQEKKDCGSNFVSSVVQQFLKYMTCYKQPLVKMLLWKAGGVQSSKDG